MMAPEEYNIDTLRTQERMAAAATDTLRPLLCEKGGERATAVVICVRKVWDIVRLLTVRPMAVVKAGLPAAQPLCR